MALFNNDAEERRRKAKELYESYKRRDNPQSYSDGDTTSSLDRSVAMVKANTYEKQMRAAAEANKSQAVIDAQKAYANVNDQAKGLLYQYSQKYGANQKNTDAGAANLANQISSKSGLYGDDLANMMTNMETINKYNKEVSSKGYKNLNDDEKLDYARAKLTTLSNDQQTFLKEYAKAYSNVNKELFDPVQVSEGDNVWERMKNSVVQSYKNDEQFGSSAIQLLKDKARAQKLYGWTPEETDQYFDYAKRIQNYEDQQALNATAQINESDNKVKKAVQNTAASVLNPQASLFTLGATSNFATNSLGYDVNSPWNRAFNYKNENQAQVTNAIGDDTLGQRIGQFAYNTGMSTIDSAEQILLTGGLGEFASLVPFFSGALTQSYSDAKSRGLNDDKAALYGLAGGVAEAAMELIPMENFWKIAKGAGFSGTKEAFKAWGKQVIEEGLEEGGTDILNMISDKLIAGSEGKTSYDYSVKEYMDNGYNEDDAKNQATWDAIKEIGLDILGGAISGGVMGGVGIGINTVKTNKEMQSTKEMYANYSKEVNEESQYGKDTKAQYESYSQNPIKAYADKIDDSTDKGKEIRSQLNQLADKVGDKKLSANDQVKFNRLIEESKSIESTEESTKYVKNIARNAAIVPEQYRTAVTGITENQARQQLVEASKAGDAEKIDNIHKLMKNSTSSEVRNNADSILSDYEMMAKGNGVSNDAWSSITVNTSEDAYLKGVRGETIDGVMTNAVREAYNAGVQQGKENKANTVNMFANSKSTLTAQNAYKANISEDVNIRQYDEAFDKAYNAGAIGMSYDSVDASAVSLLGEEAVKNIYNAGAQDFIAKADVEAANIVNNALKVEKKGTGTFIDARTNSTNNIDTSFMRAVAKITGLDIKLINSATSNEQASFRPSKSEIVVTEDHASQLIHELGEFAEFYASKEYDKVRSAVLGAANEILGATEFNNVLNNYQRTYKSVFEGQNIKDSSKEMANDYLVAMMSTEEGQKAFADYLSKNYTEAEAKTLGQKIADFFKGIIDSLRSMIGSTKLNGYQQKILNSEIAKNEANMKLFLDALDTAISNYKEANMSVEERTNETINKVGLEYDAASESINPTSFSLTTWTESEYVKYREESIKAISETLNVSEEDAANYIDDINSIAKMIADNRTKLDFDADPNNSSMVSNAEYGVTIDFSTICKKRLLYTGTLQAIQKKIGNRVITMDDYLEIRNAMLDDNLETTCGCCYVEGSRVKLGQYMKEFIKRYAEDNPKYVPTMYDVTMPDGIRALRAKHPEVWEARKYFLNHYGQIEGHVGEKNLFSAQAKPKDYTERTEYRGEILDKFLNNAKAVEEKNKDGGLKIQSFSDFEIVNLIDCMQVIMDMSRCGLMGQAYTKVYDFADALGNTGLKINLSLMGAGVDANGDLILDEINGMKKADAIKLRNKYSKNVGTIIVAFTDEQIRAAMKSDYIDFIIPFHRSQWRKTQFEALGLPEGTKDYTQHQNDRIIKDNGRLKKAESNHMPNEYWDNTKTGRENAEHYIDMCNKEGKAPKFPFLLGKDSNGKYYLPEGKEYDGYFKLLIDFKMYDNEGNNAPQMPVKPNFSMDECKAMLENYTGGHNSFPVANKIVDSFAEKIIARGDEFKYSLEVDSDGRQLTEEQAEYFKDSKVRDDNGNLKVMYHGTSDGGFYTFENDKSDDGLSFFFSDDETVANTYNPEDNLNGLYKVYLNITNPLVVDGHNKKWNDLRLSTDENSEKMTTRQISKYAKENGYDGVIFNNVKDKNALYQIGEASTVAVAFDSNQIKYVRNKKPTSNPDIRYSIDTEMDKKLSSDEYIKTNQRRVANEESVTVVKDQESTIPFSNAKDSLYKIFDSIKTVNTELGDVVVDKNSADSVVAHKPTRTKLLAASKIKDILSKGNVVYYDNNNLRGKGYDVAVIAAPITIEGGNYPGEYLVGAQVNILKKENTYYLNEVVEIKKDNSLPLLQTSSKTGDKGYPSVISILRDTMSYNKKFSLNVGYHAGDLGKAEAYSNMSADRDTGHFGTGTYFVGDESKIGKGTGYGERPHYTVDFSKYNLFRPLLESDGKELHRFLKGINSFLDVSENTPKRENDWNNLRNNIYKGITYDDMPIEIALVELRQLLGEYFVNDELSEFTDGKVWVNSKNELLDEKSKTITDDQIIKQYDIEEFIENMLDKYDEPPKHISDYIDWNTDLFKAEFILGVPKEKISSIYAEIKNSLKNVNKNTATTQDSASTMFMKKLGYEGIDVRRLKGLDNTAYGSVIYDLKGDDLERKISNGARFSLDVDTDGNRLSSQQQEFFKGSKARDDDGSLKVLYHGTNDFGFNIFDPDKSDDGISLFFTDDIAMSQTYTKNKENVYKVYLNLENPLIIDAHSRKWNDLRLVENEVSIVDKIERLVDLEQNFDEAIDIGLILESAGDLASSAEYIIGESSDLFDDSEKELILKLSEEIDQAYEEWDNDEIDFSDYILDNKSKRMNTRGVAKYAKDNGYDGVIVKNVYDNGFYSTKHGYDGFGNVYIVFESNQVKSIYNNSPTDSNDIRYSLDLGWVQLEEEYSPSMENESILEKGLEALKGKDVDTKTINTIAAKLKNEFASTIDKKSFADMLARAFSYLHSQDNITFKDVMSLFEEVARPVIDQSTKVENADMYNEFVDYFRGNKIRLTDKQLAEVRATYGSYEDFKKAMSPLQFSINGNMSLENNWMQLADSFAGLVDYDITESEMPLALNDILESLRPSPVNTFGADADEVAKDLAMRIVTEYMDAQSDAKVKKAAEQMRESNKQYRADVRRRYQDKLAKAKSSGDTRVAEVKAKAKNKMTTYKDRQKAVETKKQISKLYNDLTQRIVHPTENKHVPTAMKKPLMEFLQFFNFVEPEIKYDAKNKQYKIDMLDYSEMINGVNHNHMMTVTGKTTTEVLTNFYAALNAGAGSQNQKRWQEALSNLSDLFDANYESEEGLDEVLNMLNVNLSTELKNIIKKNDNVISVNNLSNDDLKTIKNALKNILHAINYQDMWYTLDQSVKDTAHDIQNTANNLKAKNHTKAYNALHTGLVMNMMSPDTYFTLLGEKGKGIYTALQRALEKKMKYVQQTEKYTKELIDKTDIKDWRRDVLTIDTSEGELKMTVAQIMSLYELSKRKQAVLHMAGGIIADRVIDGKLKKIEINQMNGIHLTEDEMTNLFNMLTDEQKAIADGLQQYMASECGSWGNEASELMYGYERFLDENYFPITTDSDSNMSKNMDAFMNTLNGIERMGFTKDVTEFASNPIIIKDIFSVFSEHAANMATYAAYAPAIKDALRVYNFKEVVQNGDNKNYIPVKKALNVCMGRTDSSGKAYFEKLIRDINGSERSNGMKSFGEQFVGAYKAAAVGANIRVVVQQPTAYLRASAIIDPKYLAEAAPKAFIHNMENLKDENALIYLKSQGYYETSLGKNMDTIMFGNSSFKDTLVDASMWLAGKADDMTWACLYDAAERQVKAENQGLSEEEIKTKTNDLFAEVIHQTQVVDATIMKSPWQRSKDGKDSIMNAFMAEPIKSYNMALKVLIQGARGAVSSKTIMRVGLALLTTDMVNALAQALIDALRYHDDDEEYKDEVLKYWFENFKDNVNPIKRIPFLKDVWDQAEKIISGESTYGQTNGQLYEYAAMNSIFDAIATLKKQIEGDYNKTNYAAYMTYAKAASQMLGIPVYNFSRDAVALWNFYTDKDLVKQTEKASDKYNKIIDAINNGKADEDLNEAVRKALESNGTVNAIESKLSSAYKSDYLEALEENSEDADEIKEKAVRGFMAVGLSRSDAEKEVESWTEEKIGYSILDKAIESGDGLELATQLMMDNKDTEKILDHIYNSYSATIDYNRAKGYSTAIEDNVNDVLNRIDGSNYDILAKNQIQKAQEKAEKARITELKNASKEKIYSAIDNGTDYTEGINDALNAGMEYDDIKSAITSQYKKKFLEAYNSGNYDMARIYRQRIASVKAFCDQMSGLKIPNKYGGNYLTYEMDQIDKWLSNN